MFCDIFITCRSSLISSNRSDQKVWRVCLLSTKGAKQDHATDCTRKMEDLALTDKLRDARIVAAWQSCSKSYPALSTFWKLMETVVYKMKLTMNPVRSEMSDWWWTHQESVTAETKCHFSTDFYTSRHRHHWSVFWPIETNTRFRNFHIGKKATSLFCIQSHVPVLTFEPGLHIWAWSISGPVLHTFPFRLWSGAQL